MKTSNEALQQKAHMATKKLVTKSTNFVAKRISDKYTIGRQRPVTKSIGDQIISRHCMLIFSDKLKWSPKIIYFVTVKF